MRCRSAGDRGGATAELAVALPAVAVLIAVCVSGVALGGVQVAASDAAAQAARLIARGEPDGVGAVVAQVGVGSEWTSSEHDGLVCVRITRTVPLAAVLPIELQAQQCALADGG